MSVFLTKNAPGLRTSPVKRGYWVVHRLLGEYIPAPPPNVPVLPTDETKLGDLTLRETLAQHRANPACSSCHAKFDSFGLAFEGYGPIGETRDRDLAGRPVETGATFPDGSAGVGSRRTARVHARARAESNSSTTCAASCSSMPWAAACCARTSRSSPTCASICRPAAIKFGLLVQDIVTSRQFLTKRTDAQLAQGTR